ncbi:MAG TPA: hypothetical protein VLQ20_02385 [Planococcus sp. (in: firmicutes)]|nr:hypothetical protein [Planococcus sp. (in: firmicutes)]
MGIDEQWICRIADRDKQALSEIYDRYHLLVWNFARRNQADHEACEKLVHHVFNQLWAHPEEFKNGRRLALLLIECCKSKMAAQQKMKKCC